MYEIFFLSHFLWATFCYLFISIDVIQTMPDFKALHTLQIILFRFYDCVIYPFFFNKFEEFIWRNILLKFIVDIGNTLWNNVKVVNNLLYSLEHLFPNMIRISLI